MNCELNILALEQELSWLKSVIEQRVFRLKDNSCSGQIQSAPELKESAYKEFLASNNFNEEERLILALGFAPHLQPELLDILLSRNEITGQVFTQAGGIKGNGHIGFLPTVQTALFVLSGNDFLTRVKSTAYFAPEHPFFKKHFFLLPEINFGEPLESRALILSEDILDLIQGKNLRFPEFNSSFPAKRITTSMDWEDLVLSPMTLRQVEEVKVWLKHGASLHEELGMHKRLKPGYRALFYGPPGTGKTLTACLLGKFLDRPVFRIDLSMVVNKYIGETEKNLAKIFDKAEHANWILFFDEADALFGKRTSSNSSNDRYANQEVSYLLQRIEDFPGIVILASNMKSNIDDAFARRFQSMVHFASPKGDERRRLWKNAFSSKLQFSAEVDIVKLADKYDLSGGHITNVVAWCSLMALDKGDYLVTEQLLREGIARELAKEGRTL